uniref:Uncharacterized protein n=1 Tax=Onchocerca volvulus TaxID=6282 RepID=A0A8R1XUS4_ONCVO
MIIPGVQMVFISGIIPSKQRFLQNIVCSQLISTNCHGIFLRSAKLISDVPDQDSYFHSLYYIWPVDMLFTVVDCNECRNGNSVVVRFMVHKLLYRRKGQKDAIVIPGEELLIGVSEFKLIS